MSQQEAKGKGKEKKQVTFSIGGAKLAGYGGIVLFLMVWVFALGVLTGRGDVNRLFQRLGLSETGLAARLGVAPAPSAPEALPLPSSPEQPKAMAAVEPKTTTAEGAAAVTSVPPPKEAQAAASKPAAAGAAKPGVAVKQAKGAPAQKPAQPSSIASKLSFQNSFEPAGRKQPKIMAKKEAGVHTANIAAPAAASQTEKPVDAEKKKTASAYQVKVASYRSAAEAQKTLTDLKKKGFNVSLHKGKDKTGETFTISTGRYQTKTEAEKVTQKLKAAQLSGRILEVKP